MPKPARGYAPLPMTLKGSPAGPSESSAAFSQGLDPRAPPTRVDAAPAPKLLPFEPIKKMKGRRISPAPATQIQHTHINTHQLEEYAKILCQRGKGFYKRSKQKYEVGEPTPQPTILRMVICMHKVGVDLNQLLEKSLNIAVVETGAKNDARPATVACRAHCKARERKVATWVEAFGE